MKKVSLIKTDIKQVILHDSKTVRFASMVNPIRVSGSLEDEFVCAEFNSPVRVVKQAVPAHIAPEDWLRQWPDAHWEKETSAVGYVYIMRFALDPITDMLVQAVVNEERNKATLRTAKAQAELYDAQGELGRAYERINQYNDMPLWKRLWRTLLGEIV